MKGRQILVEPLPNGGDIAVLMVDGRMEDILVDRTANGAPEPEAIFFARALRPMKGLGATMVDIGNGQHGFLRQKPGSFPKQGGLVQVTGWNEAGKAPPVSARPSLRRRTAVLTPGVPGLNISRSIRDPDVRAALDLTAARLIQDTEGSPGLIIRSAAEFCDEGEITADIEALLRDWAVICRICETGRCGLALPAPGAGQTAQRDWSDANTEIIHHGTALADAGIWDEIDRIFATRVELGDGFVMIEPTSALVAVDVNTGADTSPAAGLKANVAVARDLPRQLRLRGLGGQIIVDLAPMPHSGRGTVEQILKAALRRDGIETTIAGWTPLGHLELNRQRSRMPLDLRTFASLRTPGGGAGVA